MNPGARRVLQRPSLGLKNVEAEPIASSATAVPAPNANMVSAPAIAEAASMAFSSAAYMRPHGRKPSVSPRDNLLPGDVSRRATARENRLGWLIWIRPFEGSSPTIKAAATIIAAPET